jgi:opacity protein-like surface antigen
MTHHRTLPAVGAAFAAILVLACPVRAADDAPDGPAADASAFSLSWELFGATDDLDAGLTTTGHEPYASGRVTAGFGLFRLEAAAWTEGDAPDAAFELKAGVAPSLGDVALDASLSRTISPDEPSAEEWVVDANATLAAGDAVEINLGASFTAPDDEGDYADLYASVAVTLEGDWVATGEVDFEPDDGSGERYLQAILGLEVPLPHALTLSGEVGYEWFSDPASPDYVHWNAGVTWDALDGVAFDLRYHGNDLSEADCAAQSDHACDHRVIASVTYSGAYPAGE